MAATWAKNLRVFLTSLNSDLPSNLAVSSSCSNYEYSVSLRYLYDLRIPSMNFINLSIFRLLEMDLTIRLQTVMIFKVLPETPLFWREMEYNSIMYCSKAQTLSRPDELFIITEIWCASSECAFCCEGSKPLDFEAFWYLVWFAILFFNFKLILNSW